MEVLYFIDKNVRMGDNEVFDYLPSLIQILSSSMKTSVLSPAYLFKADRQNIYNYGTSMFYVIKNILYFSDVLDKLNPDIVHIHGCSSILSAVFMRKCLNRNIPVIITPGKYFEPWNIRQSYLMSRLPRLFLYQRSMLRQACAVHALTSQEHNDILSLSWHPALQAKTPLNVNTAIIDNYNTAPAMSVEDMASRMFTLYSKVADSNPFMLMNSTDIQCEDILLADGAAPSDSVRGTLTDRQRTLLTILDDVSMRRILLHAADEGIYKYVMDGALRLKVHVPALNVYAVERFKSHYHNAKTAGHEGNVPTTGFDNDDTLTEAERNVCITLEDTWHKYRHNALRRADLLRLYTVLRNTDYDEVMLYHALRRTKLIKRSARLLALLGERYTLTEGFMFIPPLNDCGTIRMRNHLRRAGIQ